MKKLLLLSFLSITSTFIFAQDDIRSSSKLSNMTITPGVGIGPLKLGMDEISVYNLLQGEIKWKTYKEQLKIYKDFEDANFAIDSTTAFVLGFDSCASYSNNLPQAIPVFSIYFKKHKLILITVTSYGVLDSTDLQNKIALNNGIHFFTSMAECKTKMDSKHLHINLKGYDGDDIYYKQVIEFFFDHEKLTALNIFKASTDFPLQIETKRNKLKLEYKMMK